MPLTADGTVIDLTNISIYDLNGIVPEKAQIYVISGRKHGERTVISLGLMNATMFIWNGINFLQVEKKKKERKPCGGW